jgi:serine/threonine protein phosphatase PrpC
MEREGQERQHPTTPDHILLSQSRRRLEQRQGPVEAMRVFNAATRAL